MQWGPDLGEVSAEVRGRVLALRHLHDGRRVLHRAGEAGSTARALSLEHLVVSILGLLLSRQVHLIIVSLDGVGKAFVRCF